MSSATIGKGNKNKFTCPAGNFKFNDSTMYVKSSGILKYYVN